MSRIIKFRAFDPYSGRLWYFGEFSYRNNRGEKTWLGLEATSNEVEASPQDRVFAPAAASVVLEQFTGLYDMDGHEIYENDLITFGGLPPVQIIWKDCGFIDANDTLNLTDKGTRVLAKVIGNVHMNPELITGGSRRVG